MKKGVIVFALVLSFLCAYTIWEKIRCFNIPEKDNMDNETMIYEIHNRIEVSSTTSKKYSSFSTPSLFGDFGCTTCTKLKGKLGIL